MPRNLTVISKGRACDRTLLCVYAILWAGHVALGISALSGVWSASEDEKRLILGWCGFIVAVIPFALLAMRRTQVLEATGQGITVRSTGVPFGSKREVPRSAGVKLDLLSCCWGSYDLLVLEWGRMPWQSVYLAPLASTDEKKSIGEEVARFLSDNQVEFASSLANRGPGGEGVLL